MRWRPLAGNGLPLDRWRTNDRPVTNDFPEWRVTEAPVPYPAALTLMEARASAIREGGAHELVWLIEHPPLFTSGTSADPAELFNPLEFPVYAAGRGGRFTYHGPGQRVGYLMLDLDRRGRDIRLFVHALEGWLIAALGRLDVEARREPGRIGLWVGRGPEEAKIAAIGVRIRRWVTLHGFSVNVSPDLGHFAGIVPCGISEHGVTSLEALGKSTSMKALDDALEAEFPSFLKSLTVQRKVT